ncbi:hypothetical protein NW759_017314, partial [Fusarium solani]
SFPDSHQRLLPSKPPRLQFYTSDPVAPPTTNHELFKDTVPQPFYYEHKVRAPFTVGCQYRSTDNTTVTAQITQTPEMVNPTKPEREVIPPTLHTVAQVENKNGLLRDKTIITTAEATMARGRVFQKSAEVFVNKQTSKDWEAGVFVGVSRTNGENMYHAGVRTSYKPK